LFPVPPIIKQLFPKIERVQNWQQRAVKSLASEMLRSAGGEKILPIIEGTCKFHEPEMAALSMSG